MAYGVADQSLDNLIIVGDRVLVKPRSQQDKTKSGLYLPPGVAEKERIYTGYVIKVGPGYPIPTMMDYDEPWKDKSEQVKYVPLQAKVGDLAVYLQSSGYDIEINNQKYVIIPYNAILLLFRDEDLFK